MTQKYSIELIEEHDAVNFYSVHLGEEELSELEQFFEKFPEGCDYDEDIDTITAWLDWIGESGALERYFRYEGRFGDGVSAIPIEQAICVFTASVFQTRYLSSATEASKTARYGRTVKPCLIMWRCLSIQAGSYHPACQTALSI